MGLRYLSDEEIEAGYSAILEKDTEFKIEFKGPERDSGWIEINLPQNEERNRTLVRDNPDYEDDDLFEEEMCDSFIIYENGSVALDNWYPTKAFLKIVDEIISKVQENPDTDAKIKMIERYT